ncbi:hypothetical protein SASPL_131296 [Salvia splendens]|uniref:Retrotransposon gag domain-containing protein n=1 Tax=Salvia splendens TaxID=180675 RepID=A0A8X8X778_SALSN|nr:hypothetical protein SASPL_131296 [Salvia splendens]
MASASQPSEDALAEYSIQELGQMLFDVKVRLSNNEKTMMSNPVENLGSTQPKPTASVPASRGWSIPMSVVSKPPTFDPDSWPKLKFDPPRFGNDNVVRWIKRIQKYYNHSFTPLADCLYLTEFLLDDATAEWFSYWEDNNNGKTWDEFLIAAKLRFDPDLYEDYVGRLATLRQSSSLNDYLKAFEPVLQKVGNATLWPSLSSFRLVTQPLRLGCQSRILQWIRATRNKSQNIPHRTLDRRVTQARLWDVTIVMVHLVTTQLCGSQPAEKAEKAKRGECFYCPEKYSRTHICKKKFYAFMGEDDVEEIPETQDASDSEDEANTMVITGDISTIHVIGPKLRPRAIRLTRHIHESPISVLIDGGSIHNFFKPAVAEKLSLSLHSVTPFRVFVENGDSLRCKYVCLSTPISLHGHMFAIDLFILQVEGPDIILGVQLLQDLGEVTKNYKTLSMKFKWEDRLITL